MTVSLRVASVLMVLIAIGLAGIGLVMRASPSIPGGAVRVVPGSPTIKATPAPPRVPDPINSQTGGGATPQTTATHVARTYPVLDSVSLSCAAEQCVLTGRVPPVQAQADLDQRQEMLLGGLAATLAADGYRLAVPFDFVEVDSNQFDLRATVTREGATTHH